MKSLEQALSSQIFDKNSLSHWKEKLKSELEKSHIPFDESRQYLFTIEDEKNYKSLFFKSRELTIHKRKKVSYGTTMYGPSTENTIRQVENRKSAGNSYIIFNPEFLSRPNGQQGNIHKVLSKYGSLIHYVINTPETDVINDAVFEDMIELENITLTICTKPSNLESLISQEIFKKNKFKFFNIDCNKISAGQIILAFEKCLDLQSEIGFEKLYVSVSIGEDFFYEISKLRALRFLLSLLMSERKQSIDFEILAFIDLSLIEENHYKVLKATTSGTAAIIGGADGVVFDFGKNDVDETYARVYEDMTAVLCEESKMNEPEDPAKESFFIESLTYKIAKEAWEEFVS